MNAHSSAPVAPENLIGDEWMDDPASRELFERGLVYLDQVLRPMTDALDKSVVLDHTDYAVRFNPF